MICQQVCVPLCQKIQVDVGHTAYRSMIKRLDINEPHVTLLCAPRSSWAVLREDRLCSSNAIQTDE